MNKAKLIIKCNNMLVAINHLIAIGKTQEAAKLQKRYDEAASFIPYVGVK